jgi:uncharacterized membrane protein
MKELEKLSASPKSKAVVVAITGVTLILTYLFKDHWYAYSAVFVVAFAVSILFEHYHLNDRFIKRRKEKLLREDIVEVKQLFWFRIVTDKYGDSIWINYTPLRKEDKRKLNDWLAQ